MNAAVVGWDDLYREWLEREKNLRSDVQRYRFAQYLGRSLHYNSSLSFSRINTIERDSHQFRGVTSIRSHVGEPCKQHHQRDPGNKGPERNCQHHGLGEIPQGGP
ncbi:hypothetical protein AnigIFM63309_004229 [Aspergillus niger]|nr:hypothetical protein AnigIFM63309_004229 [Aspergillus niger]